MLILLPCCRLITSHENADEKIWFAALLAASLVAQTTNNLDETQFQPGEDTTYYFNAELDSILEELSYIPIIPRGLYSPEAAAELFCYFIESDTDVKYINTFYSPEHDMLNIVAYYDDTAEVELYGVTHNLESILLATHHTSSRNSLWFVIEQQNNPCFRGYEVILRSKKFYRDMSSYILYVGC